MTNGRIKNLLSALALAGALAFATAPVLRADDGFRPIFHPPTLSFRNVRIESAFKGLDGKTFPAGAYDMDVRQGTQGILIGLLRNGKKLAEFTGKFVPGAMNPPEPERKAGGLRSLHFDTSSKVSFGGGGGAGKISCSNNLHPGGASLGWIEFKLPAM